MDAKTTQVTKKRKTMEPTVGVEKTIKCPPPFYASKMAMEARKTGSDSKDLEIPDEGIPATYAREQLANRHCLEFNERLNTSSYVNVVFEKEEQEVALMGLGINLADQNVYPNSWQIHNDCLNMVARLWNCPYNKEEFEKYGNVFPGAGTVGSTEACLLAGIALKKRWEAWFKGKHEGKSPSAMGKKPNLVISTLYQACWEKLFRYMDIEPRLVKCTLDAFKLNPQDAIAEIDDCTIGVVCIMGNHYGGQYDPVLEMGKALEKLNKEKGYQVGIHVDAASGGFIAPFQPNLPIWDFRVPQVLSISASGHKFGQSCAGSGWVVWRQREGLAAHIAINVTYLGGSSDSYTLNFSRPATGVYVQYYKFLRLGKAGYQSLCNNMMGVAKMIRDGIKVMKSKTSGKPLFRLLDDGDDSCLPVVSAMINPALGIKYDDIDFQNMLATTHWYVSGYRLGFHDPITEETVALFKDTDKNQTMFRVVVKANMTASLAKDLLKKIAHCVEWCNHAVECGWEPHMRYHKVRKLGHPASHAHSTC
mmetsp:Transcript_26319/g.51047  ORF Transcript_26319/g.51047 Transcript_26319/m.51047 type:complete len:533 (-) Transcript_26319:304-1902(-)